MMITRLPTGAPANTDSLCHFHSPRLLFHGVQGFLSLRETTPGSQVEVSSIRSIHFTWKNTLFAVTVWLCICDGCVCVC